MKHLFSPFFLLFLLISNIFCVIEYDPVEKEKVIVLRSRTYSTVYMSDDITDREILPFLSIILDNAPDSYTYDAYTYGETSGNDPLGERIDWEATFTTQADTTMQEFETSSEYFFLYVRNLTSTDFGPITINYGNANEYTENIIIPAYNGLIYRIAYYKVHSDTQIRFYEMNQPSEYVATTAGIDFEFPNTENQNVIVEISNKSIQALVNNTIPAYSSKVNTLK